MIYFLLGENTAGKDTKIAAWKQEYLTSSQANNFDYEVLSAIKCDSFALKKALIALPALAKKRLVVLHDCHKLSDHNQELIAEFANSNHDHIALILESSLWEPTHSFIKSIQRIESSAKIMDTGRAAKLNVFHMTKAIGRQNGADALKILSDLFSEGNHPLQIMGGLVWFWGSERQRMSSAKFEKGLLALSEADLNIKRSRLKTEQAVELLVVKLCAL
jgi:DNA polymerase III delta subunit